MVYCFEVCAAAAGLAVAGACAAAAGGAAWTGRQPATRSAAVRPSERKRRAIFIGTSLERLAESSHNRETVPVPVRRKRVRRRSPSPTAGTGTGTPCAFEGRRAHPFNVRRGAFLPVSRRRVAGELHVPAPADGPAPPVARDLHRSLPVAEGDVQLLVREQRPDLEVQLLGRDAYPPLSGVAAAAPGASPLAGGCDLEIGKPQ